MIRALLSILSKAKRDKDIQNIIGNTNSKLWRGLTGL
jgi:hypothetical protein